MRYGRDPLSLDESGTPIGLATTQCGRREAGIPAAVQAYCDVYGESLLEGWGKRRSEWQFGIGIQHELLPRFSAEVTYNRRNYSNLTVTDQIGLGCDRFNGAQDLQTCNENYLNHTDAASFDFYRVVAPSHPALPDGGGYTISGLSTDKFCIGSRPAGRGDDHRRAELPVERRGHQLRVARHRASGAFAACASTAAPPPAVPCVTCASPRSIGPDVRQNEGHAPECNPATRWETNVRGTAAYTILADKPWADILVSTVFQWRPGVERAANHAFTKDQVTLGAEQRLPRDAGVCPGRSPRPVRWGVLSAPVPARTRRRSQTINLLNTGELYGEGYTIFDLKLAKNIRFANKRLNIGVDVYNLFNNDAVRTYQDNYDVADNPATAVVEQWGQATGLLSPRFARLSVQFDF